MFIKGASQHAKVINSEDALKFAGTIRGQYIISQALSIARNVLIKYEHSPDEKKRFMKAQPSNRADMDYLLEAFPLYRIHDVIKEDYEMMENDKNEYEKPLVSHHKQYKPIIDDNRESDE